MPTQIGDDDWNVIENWKIIEILKIVFTFESACLK